MGNFSRDPDARLVDARGKHHVAVRLQQGVPVLDADWNALDDLRRAEVEDFGRWSIGDGVPSGSDGFHIVAIAGGGVNTIVLKSTATGLGLSSVEVDVAASTSAAVLGFTTDNRGSARLGSSPAQLTGNAAAPFGLTDGATLVVRAEGNAPETITFHAASFANIAAATAAEVSAAINAVAVRVSAGPGTGNDFIIRGGDGTTPNGGRIVVGGRMAINESDLKFSEQLLFANAALAAQWGVTPIPPLASSLDPQVAFLDLWHREVDSEEDAALVDARIGVETALRLRREWAVRVVRAADLPATLAAAPPGHAFYPLARFTRTGAGNVLTDAGIVDLRDNDVSLRRGVAFRGAGGFVLVDSSAFRTLLGETRDDVRAFLAFLGTKFVTPDSAYAAGEVAGFQALGAIAEIADHGLALLSARSLDTAAALDVMEQLRAAEVHMVTVWKAGVLPLTKPGGKIYETAFKTMIDQINAFLAGPAPVGFVSLVDALNARNLFDAARTQHAINDELGDQTLRPTGFLGITYLGSPSPIIVRNVPFDLRFRVTGSVTPQDQLDPVVTIGNGWAKSFRNGDGSVPLALSMGPGAGTQEFLVTVTPPNLAAAETDITLEVHARHNASGLTHTAFPKHLKITAPPPPSEADFSFDINTSNVVLAGGELQVPTNLLSANLLFRLANNTNAAVTVNLQQQPASDPAWQIVRGPFNPIGQVIPAHDHKDFLYQFGPPTTVGQLLTFTLTAVNQPNNATLAEITVKLRTVQP